jgi:hypothetical protein
VASFTIDEVEDERNRRIYSTDPLDPIDAIRVENAALKEMILGKEEPAKPGPTLRAHQPEAENKVHAVLDDIEFDDSLIAKMFANLAALGMTPQYLAG